ncbi:DEAD/DEAH box helicase [Gordonia sp. VNK21]|uniref:DEAD/DEAH box helicase n=1 Tax=Gordonia sp. VNK21 TaxID=3382483 RepID=UPI0038D48FBF
MAGTVYNSYAERAGVRNGLYDGLRRSFKDAQRRLWITVPWWDTSEPASILLHDVITAQRRGVDVRVIARTDPNNDAALARLRDASIEVVRIRNVHDKYVLFDDAVAVQSSNFTRKELRVNENSGLFISDAGTVSTYEAMFEQLVANRAALAIGQEEWTPAESLIPPELTKYLDRFERLNPLQSKAVPAVLSTAGHTMVVAPTSAGKTLVGQVAALRSIVLEGRPAVWLLPARALAAEVADTAAKWRQLGISTLELTGEVNIASDKARKAQLWVATTEKFESMYRRSTLSDHFDRVGCLIIDEVHLVGDSSRGATLESVIARLRLAESRTRIVALSATVANAQELADWFHAQLIQSKWRPTVLTTQLVPYGSGPGESEWAQEESGKNATLKRLLLDLAATGPDDEDRPDSLREALGDGTTLGSLLVFCGSKNAVRGTSAMLAEVTAIQGDDEQLVAETTKRGVGIHFRDAPQAADSLQAFNNRQLNTLVATSGLSTGVNTPARIVVIRDLTLGISDLEVSQAQQMLGRAGRAGQEREGFGYLLVPRHKEVEWRRKLAEGYRVDSQLISQIADVILAEILLGSITSRADAEIWFKGTFAYAQSTQMHDVGEVIDRLVKYHLADEGDKTLSATELGKLTARLMIGVPAACGILDGLASLGFPADATHAENLVLGLVARSVPDLRDLPVNPRTYENWTAGTLASCGDGLDQYVGDEFGSRFAAGTAAAALRQQSLLSVPRGSKMSRGEMVRAVAELPRFLNWLGALGALGESTWAPAVAGDLSRRLQWWNLNPTPQRGSGRLLTFLEQLLDPEHQNRRMPGLWKRARQAGFDQPNAINVSPRNVDASPETFAKIVSGRAHLVLPPAEGTAIEVEASPYDAQITVITNSGSLPDYSSTKALGQTINLPLPHGSASEELAADIILYARNDCAYQNLVTDIPNRNTADNDKTMREVRRLIGRLVPSAAVAPHTSRVRRVFMGDRKRTLAELMPQVATGPDLDQVAVLLAGHALDVESRIVNLRLGLESLLNESSSGGPLRSAGSVLKSGTATPHEFECVLIALATSLGAEMGMATSSKGKLIALVEVDGQWRMATPITSTDYISQPLSPDTLPANIVPIAPSQPRGPVKPLFPWLAEFTPGSGEPIPARRPTASGESLRASAGPGTAGTAYAARDRSTNSAPRDIAAPLIDQIGNEVGTPVEQSRSSTTSVTHCSECGSPLANDSTCDECNVDYALDDDDDRSCEECGSPLDMDSNCNECEENAAFCCGECGELDDETVCYECDERICASCGCTACESNRTALDKWACDYCGSEFGGQCDCL